jgi:hypothetical protein
MSLKLKNGGYLRNATSRLTEGRMDEVIAGYFDSAKPIAFMFGLPLNARETMAFMAHEAGTHTDEQRDLLVAWRVKMALVHGTWVNETLPNF